MRTIVTTTWTTLDGFVAGPDGEMDFVGRFFDEEMGRYESELATGADTLLLGRVTYDSFAGSWPHVPDRPDVDPAEREYAQLLNAMRKVVISSSLTDPSWEHTDVLRGIDRDQIQALKDEPGKDIVVYGSASVVRQLTALELVDEFHVLVHPVVLGAGRSLFGGLQTPAYLALESATPHPSGVVRLVYRRG